MQSVFLGVAIQVSVAISPNFVQTIVEETHLFASLSQLTGQSCLRDTVESMMRVARLFVIAMRVTMVARAHKATRNS